MDCYFVTGINVELRIVRVQHCDRLTGSGRFVTADNAYRAAAAQKLKGCVNGRLVPCLEFNKHYEQDYYFCSGKLYRFINWQYTEVFPWAFTEYAGVYVVGGYVLVAGDAKYHFSRLESSKCGYYPLSCEVFPRSSYELIAVQSVKTAGINFITAIGTELFRETKEGIALVRSTDFSKFDRIMRRINEAIAAGENHEYDKVLSDMQQFDLQDTGQNILLGGRVIY